MTAIYCTDQHFGINRHCCQVIPCVESSLLIPHDTNTSIQIQVRHPIPAMKRSRHCPTTSGIYAIVVHNVPPQNNKFTPNHLPSSKSINNPQSNTHRHPHHTKRTPRLPRGSNIPRTTPDNKPARRRARAGTHTALQPSTRNAAQRGAHARRARRRERDARLAPAVDHRRPRRPGHDDGDSRAAPGPFEERGARVVVGAAPARGAGAGAHVGERGGRVGEGKVGVGHV